LERSSKQDWVSSSPLQISTDNVLQAAKIQSNQAAQCTILISNTDSGFSQQFIDRKSSHGVNKKANSYFNPITQKFTSYVVFNGASNDFSEHFIPGAKLLGLSSQLVEVVKNFLKICGEIISLCHLRIIQ